MMEKKERMIEQEIDRRKFLRGLGLGIGAAAFGIYGANAGSNTQNLTKLFAQTMETPAMGIVVHSYWARWNSKTASDQYPSFTNALQLLRHCKEIGAGGIQVTLNDWTDDFTKKMRDEREKLGLYLEGSIGLPKTEADVPRFEAQLLYAKEAGAKILRTVCMSGRRYENFHSQAEFQQFKMGAISSLRLAEPIVRKHQIKLAIENHKDWRASEMVVLIKLIQSEWIGVTLDFGNNISLLENPMEVISTLAPYSFSTHVKDMGVQEYEKGFLLSEVPLGQGIVDLPAAVALCKKSNPLITFNLEMITRDPLKIPCLDSAYYETMGDISSSALAKTLAMVREKKFAGKLPQTSSLSGEQALALEEKNIVDCLAFSKSSLGLG
jgi:sugar phosphate isomerase/epimerase